MLSHKEHSWLSDFVGQSQEIWKKEIKRETVSSRFLKISDHTLVVDFLKQKGAEAHNLYSPKTIQVASNK